MSGWTLRGRRLTSKSGSCQGVSSFISTCSKTLGESKIEVPKASAHVWPRLETAAPRLWHQRAMQGSLPVSSKAQELCARIRANSRLGGTILLWKRQMRSLTYCLSFYGAGTKNGQRQSATGRLHGRHHRTRQEKTRFSEPSSGRIII